MYMKGDGYGSVARSAALIIVVVALASVFVLTSQPGQFNPEKETGRLMKFSSEQELRDYLSEASQESGMYSLYPGAVRTISAAGSAESYDSNSAQKTEAAPSAQDFSSTNIQVTGVDEADFVKNDGRYIYAIYGNSVVIADAYPAESAKISSRINFTNSTPSEIFVSGDRMAVFGSTYSYYNPGPLRVDSAAGTAASSESLKAMPYYQSSMTFINIYDVSDRENPLLIANYSVDGNYYDSRMVGDYAYLITNEPVYSYSEDTYIPGAAYRCMPAGSCFNVWYFDSPDYSYQFTIVSSINIQSPSEPQSKVFMMGYTQNLYVSSDNIYVVYTKQMSIYDFLGRVIEAVKPLVPEDVRQKLDEIQSSSLFSNYEKYSAYGRVLQNYSETLAPEQRLAFQKNIESRTEDVYSQAEKEMERTVIHKISISGGEIEYLTSGEVPGTTLNQFSMDESGGNLRIATTTGNWQSTSKNHVYILDSGMNITGKLEDLAPGERIYSVRFIGQRAYMVTFRQVDPLYVIDLSDVSNPRVLGFLKINGVSDYLHPYDDTHLIGVGRDATEEGRIKGMKISLFDVSDVSNPAEVSSYFIGKQGTYSDALSDHKAFLFSRERGILAIPVSETIDEKYWNTWQGAYVLGISLDSGITLKGKITHMNETELNMSESSPYYYYDYNSRIRRILYMDDTLYTVSGRMIKMNSLSDMSETGKLEIEQAGYIEKYYYAE